MDEKQPLVVAKEIKEEGQYYEVDSSSDYKILSDDESKTLRRTIIATVSVFSTLNVTLTILLVVFSLSLYNGIVFITYTVLDCASGLLALSGKFVHEDFQPYSEISFSSLLSCLGGSTELMRVTRWRVQKGWLFFILIFLWLRPLALYLSVLGISSGLGMSLIGQNSCTKQPTDAFSTYHPYGVFPIGQMIRYERQQAYTFCALDGRWGFPTYENQYVKGYIRLPSSFDLNCAAQSNPGFVSIGKVIEGDPVRDQATCPDAYPNPAFGVAGPVVPGTQNLTTRLCPGNTNSPVCYRDDGTPFTCTTVSSTIDFRHSVGLPRKVCPVCLNFWRQQSGLLSGPEGYEHCAAYSSALPMPYSCVFCPGRGDGGWLSGEKYSVNDLIVAFWLSTTLAIFLPVLEWLSFTMAMWNVRRVDNVKPKDE